MINGYYDVTLDLFIFLHLTTLEEEVIAKSCSTEEADWI